MKHRQLLLLALALSAACGGRAVEEPGSAGSASSEPVSEAAASAGAGGRAPSSSPLPTHALGECTPGFSRAAFPDRSCNFLTKDGSCFDKKEQACACICPSSGSSICFSSFYDGPGTATLVQCA